MTADSQGNDLDSVKNVLTSKIIVAPYVPGKTLTASQIAPSVADPITELGDVFGSGSAPWALSPARSAAGCAVTRDAPIHQPGVHAHADPTLTLAFTAAEDNDLTRLMTIGKPDETGVYHVKDIIQDTKWFAYQETIYKSDRKRRRLGVIQITGNEPAQDTRGEVSGLSLTATWQLDPAVDGGNSRYLQSYAAV